LFHYINTDSKNGYREELARILAFKPYYKKLPKKSKSQSLKKKEVKILRNFLAEQILILPGSLKRGERGQNLQNVEHIKKKRSNISMVFFCPQPELFLITQKIINQII